MEDDRAPHGIAVFMKLVSPIFPLIGETV